MLGGENPSLTDSGSFTIRRLPVRCCHHPCTVLRTLKLAVQFCAAKSLVMLKACCDLMQHSTSSRCCCSLRDVLDHLVQDVMQVHLCGNPHATVATWSCETTAVGHARSD